MAADDDLLMITDRRLRRRWWLTRVTRFRMAMPLWFSSWQVKPTKSLLELEKTSTTTTCTMHKKTNERGKEWSNFAFVAPNNVQIEVSI